MATIEFDDVSFAYSEEADLLLRDISVTLTEQRIGIVGANGSGKSTFARLINGILDPVHGVVRVDGLDVAKDGAKVRRLVGFMFADPSAQIVMPTVEQDIAFSLRRFKLSKEEVNQRVTDIAARHGLVHLLKQPAQMLSSGQKQLLAFAAIRATDPKVLVCDEPTTLLDLTNVARFEAMIEEASEQVLVVTHSLELLGDFDRVLVIDDGGIAYDGAAKEAIAFYIELSRSRAIS